MKTIFIFLFVVFEIVLNTQSQSNSPFTKNIQRWKEGQWVYYYNIKDNGTKVDEGRRYTADYIIVKTCDEKEIEAALIKAEVDPVLDRDVKDNIQVQGKEAIEIKKTYTPSKEVTDKVKLIIDGNKLVVDVKEKETIKK